MGLPEPYAEWPGVGILYCGDCLEILPHLEAGSVDAVVTSPPYPGAEMWDCDAATLCELGLNAMDSCIPVLRDGGVICWQIGDIPAGDHGVITTTTTTTHALCRGLKLRSHVIWNKSSPNLTPPCFMRRPVVASLSHEHILIFFNGDWIPREKSSGLDQPDKTWMALSVWNLATVRDENHPAPFPVELARRCIALWSMDDDVILDPFMGSGTTAVASIRMGRRFIGIESNEEFCNHIAARIDRELSQPRLPFAEPIRETQPELFP